MNYPRRCAIAVVFAPALLAQVAEHANETYRTKEGRATIAGTLSNPSRDARQKPQELVASLDIKPGSTVADIGTGTGYMLPHLSAATGPKGRVIAQDIHTDFLDRAKETVGKAGLTNISYVQGSEDATGLEAGSVDLILLLDVYHHLNYPDKTLADLRRALKSGGRLAVVEYHKNEHSMPGGRAIQHVRLGEDDAVKEIEANGFKLARRWQHVPQVQWVAVFEKR